MGQFVKKKKKIGGVGGKYIQFRVKILEFVCSLCILLVIKNI